MLTSGECVQTARRWRRSTSVRTPIDPGEFHTGVMSTQHTEPLKPIQSKEFGGQSVLSEMTPSMVDMSKSMEVKVIRKTLCRQVGKSAHKDYMQSARHEKTKVTQGLGTMQQSGLDLL